MLIFRQRHNFHQDRTLKNPQPGSDLRISIIRAFPKDFPACFKSIITVWSGRRGRGREGNQETFHEPPDDSAPEMLCLGAHQELSHWSLDFTEVDNAQDEGKTLFPSLFCFSVTSDQGNETQVLVYLAVSTEKTPWQDRLGTGSVTTETKILSVLWAHFGASPGRA